LLVFLLVKNSSNFRNIKVDEYKLYSPTNSSKRIPLTLWWKDTIWFLNIQSKIVTF